MYTYLTYFFCPYIKIEWVQTVLFWTPLTFIAWAKTFFKLSIER